MFDDLKPVSDKQRQQRARARARVCDAARSAAVDALRGRALTHSVVAVCRYGPSLNTGDVMTLVSGGV